MQVYELEPNADYDAVLAILLQLRPHYTHETLAQQIAKQQAQGYRVVYVKADTQVLAVAGFVVTDKLAWGRHVYIDDLVTDETHRSTGAGTFLMAWFKQFCQDHDCAQLHLDSGTQRVDAHRFYLHERFHINSFHFAITELT